MESTEQNPIEYFRLKSFQSNSRVSVGNMTRAIDSLARFVGGVDFSFDSFNIDLLGEWVAHQFYDGYYAKTVAYNLSKIAALYKKAVEDGLAMPNDAFSAVIAKINGMPSKFDGVQHSSTFQRLRTIYLADYTSDGKRQLAKDVILFGILNGGLTLDQIGAFKKEDYIGCNNHIVKIVEKYAKPRNKYLFPLNQAHSTPKQLMRSMEILIDSLLKPSGISLSKNPNMTLVDLWCDVAMDCGTSSSDIAACVFETGASNAVIYCSVPSIISPDEISTIRGNVVETLTDSPVNGYAMHLRRNVTFSDLMARLNENNIILDEIFYPMEEVYRKIGKKKLFESRPVISWLVFYRTRGTQLNTLFRKIGDLAWGYRYLRDVKSQYAIIRDSEVRNYQMAIGSLSPDTQILSDEEVKFSKGDCIVILGGPMNGRHGVFIAQKKDKGDATGRIVFKIRLAGGNNVNWEVNLDPRLVKKITGDQYMELDRQFQDSLQQNKYA